MGQRGAGRGVARIADGIRAAVDAIASVLIAPPCGACGATLEFPTRGTVCARCWDSILPITPPLCDRCGDSLSTWRVASSASICARCRRGAHVVDRMRAIGMYDGSLRAILHALKYDGRRSIARPLAILMRDRGAEVLDQAACVVPVPLHPSRQRQRGFNQAADLAAHLGLPVAHALRRVRRTRSQTELPAAQRHRNVRSAFALAPRAVVSRQLAGAVVVLVDDVSTTGATLEACARTLKTAGAREVRALTAARAAIRRAPAPFVPDA